MRILRCTSGAVLALFLLSTAAEGQAKPRIAVLDFENNTTSLIFGDKLGDAAADELTTQLVKTGAFTVLERQQVQRLLDEQHAGMSGAIDPATAAQVGRLLGAQLVVLGSITQFSIDEKSGGIGPLSASYAEAESMLDVRVVSVNTGEILVVAEGQGKKRFGGARYKNVNLERDFDEGVAQEALRPAVEKAIERIVGQQDKLAAVGPAAAQLQIVGVREGQIYVDGGQNLGLQVGQRLTVQRVVDSIRDGNGNVLDEVVEQVGVLEVTRVLSRSAICKVVEGDAQEGDRVAS